MCEYIYSYIFIYLKLCWLYTNNSSCAIFERCGINLACVLLTFCLFLRASFVCDTRTLNPKPDNPYSNHNNPNPNPIKANRNRNRNPTLNPYPPLTLTLTLTLSLTVTLTPTSNPNPDPEPNPNPNHFFLFFRIRELRCRNP